MRPSLRNCTSGWISSWSVILCPLEGYHKTVSGVKVDNPIKNIVYLISMAKKIKKISKDRAQVRQASAPETPIGFGRVNFLLFGVALVVIALGFLFLTSPTFGGSFPFVHPFKAGVNGWLTMNAAPILLVIGYCILLPIAIIKR